MVKTVETGKNVCTVVLNGEECAVSFADDYLYYSISNFSDDTVYASFDSNVTADADGVVSIPSGAVKQLAVCVNAPIQPMQAVKSVNSIFIVGNGKVMVEAGRRPFFDASFKMAGKGGESINVSGEGNPVTLDGLQGGVPFADMVVSGKNLLPPMSDSVTRNGITYTVNADGTITLNGTAEKADGVDVVTKMPIKAGVYTLSGCPEGGSGTSFALRAGIGTANTLYGRDYGNGLKITVDTDTVLTLTIQNAEIGRVFDNVVFRPQLELDDTATAYEPPITGRELTVGVSGKNLIPYPYQTVSKSVGNLNIEINDNGGIIINGSHTSDVWIDICVNKISGYYIPLFKGKTYKLSGVPKNSETYMQMNFNKSDGTRDTALFSGTYDSPAYTVPEDGMYGLILIKCPANVSYSNFIIKPQLEFGDTATDYEPYHGATYTITPDTNPYIVPNDIRQQEGLNNISVSAGELSVVGVRKNAAIKKIWDNMGMDLLFDGLAIGSNPAVGIDFSGYSKFVVSNYLNTSSSNCDFAGTVLIERDRLELLISSGWFLDVPISTSYSIRDYFSGTISDASFYAMQSMDASAQYFTRIYGIR